MASPSRYFIGIDLGGTNIQAGVVDEHGQIIARDRKKTKATRGADAVIERTATLVERLIEEAALERAAIGGVGIGAPGAIDVESGVVLNAVNLRWTDLPLADRLSERLALPVILENDVSAGAWGEHVAGAARGYEDLLAVFVGTGIGGGLVLGGRLYRGAHSTAGEIGHTLLAADAPLGHRTLEELASRSSIVHRLVGLIESNHPSLVTERVEGQWHKIRSRVLADAAAEGDPLTLTLLSEAARYVGTALANAVTLLSLPCTVVGGGLVDALGEPWVEQVRQSYRERVFPAQLGDYPILLSELGDDAGLVGAGLLAAERFAGEVGPLPQSPHPEKS